MYELKLKHEVTTNSHWTPFGSVEGSSLALEHTFLTHLGNMLELCDALMLVHFLCLLSP
jgi:hypothetical protein